jgi:hypothetical protein
LNDYDVQLVLVDKESRLGVALGGDDGWQELYVGDVERLFSRREPRREA